MKIRAAVHEGFGETTDRRASVPALVFPQFPSALRGPT